MQRVAAIKRVGEWDATIADDRVVLDSGDRHRRRVVLESEGGAVLLLDWPEPVMLKNGDGFLLDNGAIVAVVGEPEPLIEISARSPLELVRLAWHIGNRHTDVQICGDHLRIRRDHVLEQMAAGLGAVIAAVEAAFDPEAATPHEHRHDHGG